jgi:hypothetical protein
MRRWRSVIPLTELPFMLPAIRQQMLQRSSGTQIAEKEISRRIVRRPQSLTSTNMIKVIAKILAWGSLLVVAACHASGSVG